MKLNNANTQLGVTFKIHEFEDKDILEMIQTPEKLTRVTDCVNADRRQKVALVDARADLSDLIYGKEADGKPIEGVTGLGFARKVKTLTKNGETAYTWGETDNEHIGRFIDALVDGSFTVEGVVIPPGDTKVKEDHAVKYLQSLADKCGDQKVDDKQVYVLDITKAVRKSGSNLVPKWALEAAANIIKNGNAQSWHDKFTNGYTSARGIVIDPIAFEPFTTQHAGHHTPEEKEAIHQQNLKNLARACMEARRQETEKLQPEFS